MPSTYEQSSCGDVPPWSSALAIFAITTTCSSGASREKEAHARSASKVQWKSDNPSIGLNSTGTCGNRSLNFARSRRGGIHAVHAESDVGAVLPKSERHCHTRHRVVAPAGKRLVPRKVLGACFVTV